MPKLRQDVVGLITSCVDRKDCKDILTTNVAPACSDEAAASVAPSVLATEVCQSLETAQKKCGVSFDMAACLSRMKLYSEDTLGQARGCSAKACTDVVACVEATLGSLAGYSTGGIELDAGKPVPDVMIDGGTPTDATLDAPEPDTRPAPVDVADGGTPPADATTDTPGLDAGASLDAAIGPQVDVNVTPDSGGPCTVDDSKVVNTSEAAIRVCLSSHQAVLNAIATLNADFAACLAMYTDSGAADGGTCSLVELETQATKIVVSVVTMKEAACPAAQGLKGMTPTQTKELHTDSSEAFSTTCTVVTDMAQVIDGIYSLVGRAQDAGARLEASVSWDAGMWDGGKPSGEIVQEMKAMAALTNEAYELGLQLDAMYRRVQTDLDAKPCR